MNPAQVHLALNHVPVVGMIVVVVALGSGLLFRTGALLRFALYLLVGLSLAAIPVYFSGGQAEEQIEDAVGVKHATIDEHEDAATFGSIGVAILGLVALVSLIRIRSAAIPRGLGLAMLVATLFMGVVLARTAHLGGQIRHPELRGELSTTPGVAGGEDRRGRGDGD